MKGYTHIIWDFNGTVYDDVEGGIRSANRLLSAHGLRPIADVAEYRSLFGFPIIDYYRRLGFDFSKTSYDQLAVEWVDYYMEETRESTAYVGALDAIDCFALQGISQILLSATERGMLLEQLKSLDLDERFDEILGQDNIHAYGKGEIGLAWRREHPDAKVLFIGDTSHDAEVAEMMDADCILLSCGHQPKVVLERCKCLAVVDHHRDLVAWLCEE